MSISIVRSVRLLIGINSTSMSKMDFWYLSSDHSVSTKARPPQVSPASPSVITPKNNTNILKNMQSNLL